MAIIYAREGNPHWPLPPNYLVLDGEGKRLARLNACMMRASPEAQVASWAFFCSYYLRPDDRATFDPMFYERPVFSTPKVHYRMVLSWSRNKPSVHGLPRGHGKSVCLESYVLFRLCSNRGDSVNIYKGTDGHVAEFFDKLKHQLESNERIREDFGNLVPRRGEALWSNRRLRTNNQNKLRGFSISGQKRGPRSKFSALDDVERDDEKKEQTDDDFIKIRRAILKVILPTLDTPESSITVVGTTVGRRSFLYHMKGESNLYEDIDPRFSDKLWEKNFYKAEGLWKEKFTDGFLALRREQLGDALYSTEYENDPQSEERTIFDIQPVLHEYVITDTDNKEYESPWESISKVTYHQTHGIQGRISTTPVSIRWRDFISSLYRFITVDYAYTSSAASDWNVIHVLGLDQLGNLFSLDMWHGKESLATVCDNMWRLAFLWSVTEVGVESYPIQESWYDLIQMLSSTIKSNSVHVPIMRKIVPPIGMSKGEKITRLESRWNKGQVKLPSHRRFEPAYSLLYDQVRSFTPDLQNLPKDDHIDTLGMSADMIRGLAVSASASPQRMTPLDRMVSGELYYPHTKVPLLAGIDLREGIPQEKLQQLLQLASSDDTIDADDSDYLI